MAAAVGVRGDYEAAQLRALAKRSEDAGQTRRLLALAAIYDGGPRADPTIRRRVLEWLLRVALIR